MANILPVSDLRNYNEVLKNCHKGEDIDELVRTRIIVLISVV